MKWTTHVDDECLIKTTHTLNMKIITQNREWNIPKMVMVTPDIAINSTKLSTKNTPPTNPYKIRPRWNVSHKELFVWHRLTLSCNKKNFLDFLELFFELEEWRTESSRRRSSFRETPMRKEECWPGRRRKDATPSWSTWWPFTTQTLTNSNTGPMDASALC